MNCNQKLLGYYNYTVVLTYIGMLTGFLGIVYAFSDAVFSALLCLMIAGFCDMFDGAIASTNKKRTEREKSFGIQIDSLSDLICFGVLPAAIVYSLNKQSRFTLPVCAVYALCALIRLAYFNVDEQERQTHCGGSREIYFGLPVTLSALFLPLFYGSVRLLNGRPGAPCTCLLTVMGMLFLIPFQLKKPRATGKICVVLCGAAEALVLAVSCLEV